MITRTESKSIKLIPIKVESETVTEFSEQSHLEEALHRVQKTTDPRLKEVLEAFIKHMFAFVNDVKPSEKEWMAGIQFLTEVGQKCDNVRQEYILFSDTFGITMLVDHHNHKAVPGVTESSVLGPFYREGAPCYRRDGKRRSG